MPSKFAQDFAKKYIGYIADHPRAKEEITKAQSKGNVGEISRVFDKLVVSTGATAEVYKDTIKAAESQTMQEHIFNEVDEVKGLLLNDTLTDFNPDFVMAIGKNRLNALAPDEECKKEFLLNLGMPDFSQEYVRAIGKNKLNDLAPDEGSKAALLEQKGMTEPELVMTLGKETLNELFPNEERKRAFLSDLSITDFTPEFVMALGKDTLNALAPDEKTKDDLIDQLLSSVAVCYSSNFVEHIELKNKKVRDYASNPVVRKDNIAWSMMDEYKNVTKDRILNSTVSSEDNEKFIYSNLKQLNIYIEFTLQDIISLRNEGNEEKNKVLLDEIIKDLGNFQEEIEPTFMTLASNNTAGIPTDKAQLNNASKLIEKTVKAVYELHQKLNKTNKPLFYDIIKKIEAFFNKFELFRKLKLISTPKIVEKMSSLKDQLKTLKSERPAKPIEKKAATATKVDQEIKSDNTPSFRR